MVKLILTKIRRSIIPCILVLFVITATHSLEAQNQVSVGFTATMQEDTWIALDSVNITNQSRSWTETIYYPDTTLQMINSVGIEEAESQNLQLFQNSPNPFSGTTEVPLHIPYKDNITMVLYDISGKQCAVYDATVEGGVHTFKISVAAAQMYLLKVHTSRGSRSIKMLSTETGGSYGIKPRAMHSQIIQKSFTDHEFQSNDSMVYTGYATYKGELCMQSISLLQPGKDTSICFNLPLPDFISFCFTAQMEDSNYQAFDSIVIINKTHRWKETIVYPDTTLILIINSLTPLTNKFLLTDSMEYIGYITYNSVKILSKTYIKFTDTDKIDIQFTFLIPDTAHLIFTAQMQEGSYQKLDSVIIYNTSSHWQKTVYYPDTSLKMTKKLYLEQDSIPNTYLFNDDMLYVGFCTYNGDQKIQRIHDVFKGRDTLIVFQMDTSLQSNNKLLLLQIDYLTYTFEKGIELTLSGNTSLSDSLPIILDYRAPGDEGSISLLYQPTNDTVFHGVIIWMGYGDMLYPSSLDTATVFDTLTTSIPMPDNSQFQKIYGSYENLTAIWEAIDNLEIVSRYLARSKRIGYFLYNRSEPRDSAYSDWFIILSE